MTVNAGFLLCVQSKNYTELFSNVNIFVESLESMKWGSYRQTKVEIRCAIMSTSPSIKGQKLTEEEKYSVGM